MRLPFTVLSDETGESGRALHILRTIRIATWTLEFFRRTTFLVGTDGTIAALWGKVKIRGHAQDVLRLAEAARHG